MNIELVSVFTEMRDRRVSVDPASFWALVQKTEGCWLWLGPCHRTGYGQYYFKGHRLAAHRIAYELENGPIPLGLQLDHLCRVRACVRPDHLEPVTQRDNIIRGVSFSAIKSRQTHCEHGHSFSPENTYFIPSRPTSRRCRSCNSANLKRWKEAQRERS